MENHILFLYRISNKMHLINCKYKRNSIMWFLTKIAVKITYGYYSGLLGFFYGAYLNYAAKIGKNIKLNHSLYGIFISENAVIGDNCTLVQHITIGSNQPISSKAPVIGDNVFIGANCCIVGKTTIGDNSIIGAGVVIANANIPPNSKVVGQKYRILN